VLGDGIFVFGQIVQPDPAAAKQGEYGPEFIPSTPLEWTNFRTSSKSPQADRAAGPGLQALDDFRYEAQIRELHQFRVGGILV